MDYNSVIKKKRDSFAEKIRSQIKQQKFLQLRKQFLQAQQQGNDYLQAQIQSEMINLLGSAEQVQKANYFLEIYQKDREQYQRKLQEEEQNSINFQKLQKQKDLEKQRNQILALFQQMQKQEQKNNQQEIQI